MLSRYPLIAITFIASVTLFSCKKDSQESKNDDGIIQIKNSTSSTRIDLSNENTVLNFEVPNASISKSNLKTQASASYPYQLVYKGKINPQIGINNNELSALEVSAYGNFYAIAYQTPGESYGGGVDIVNIQSGSPQLISSISTPDADVTCIKTGGGRLYLGMDLKTFERHKYPAPAVVGIVNTNGGNLSNPQIVGLEGYSTKDLAYNVPNDKLYAASSSNGGISVISFSGTSATRSAFESFGGARSIAISNNEIYVTNGFSYANINLNTASKTDYKLWPIPSNEVGIGSVRSLSNGNFLFGNNFYLIYVDKQTNDLIDQVDVGGWVNSISIVNDKIYASTGNSLIVAEIDNDKIKVIAKTHFSSVFGGNFNVISSKVEGNNVFVACGKRGTFVFNLEKI